MSVKSIKLEVGGREVELTLEEARALKSDLDALFPAPVTVPPVMVPYPVYVNPAPIDWRPTWTDTTDEVELFQPPLTACQS